jgi:hypothetical protein
MATYVKPILLRIADVLASQEKLPTHEDNLHYVNMLTCVAEVVFKLRFSFEAGVTKGPENKGIQIDFPNGVATQLITLGLTPPTTQIIIVSAGPYAVASAAFGKKSATILSDTSVDGLMETLRQASSANPASVK